MLGWFGIVVVESGFLSEAGALFVFPLVLVVGLYCAEGAVGDGGVVLPCLELGVADQWSDAELAVFVEV